MTWSILCLWGVALTIGCTIMMARHTIPLPTPDLEDGRTAQALNAHRVSTDADGWMMTHVLLSSCPCSRRITTHLLARHAEQGMEEHIFWVVDEDAAEQPLKDFPKRARSHGFIVHTISPAELARHYRIEAAPLLLILGPEEQQLLYSGGYTSRKQGHVIQDLEILERVRARHGPFEALPLFGCAASRALRETIDPTGGWFSGW